MDLVMKRLNAAQLPFENRERYCRPPHPQPPAGAWGHWGPVGSRWQSLELCPELGGRPAASLLDRCGKQ